MNIYNKLFNFINFTNYHFVNAIFLHFTPHYKPFYVFIHLTYFCRFQYSFRTHKVTLGIKYFITEN